MRIESPQHLNDDYLQGTEGIWTFVFIDMIIFALLFFVFSAESVQQRALFESSRASLNESFALANALLLITSSWLVVRGVQAAREGHAKRVCINLQSAMLLGAFFVISKAIEYYLKWSSGISVVTNPFYSFYFFITFIHAMHVIAGLMFMASFLKRSRDCVESRSYVVGIENLGVYWHFVDALWMFIFPLLYLI